MNFLIDIFLKYKEIISDLVGHLKLSREIKERRKVNSLS